jgi:SnoaL-like protein
MSESEKILLGRLDGLVELTTRRDISLVDELWGDGGFLMVGSERGEICRTRDEVDARLKAVFALPVTLVFDWPKRTVTIVGNAAWIVAEGTLILRHAGVADVRRPYLASCIFESVGGKWRWRQFFGSEPA